MDLKKIRNFTIIAHVDHGKSTLSDQILLNCNAVSQREFQPQMLDSMSLERERGITIKAQVATMYWKYNQEEYMLNLIDTPGHVDFNYEVSRSLMSCEISLLIIDATKGVEAQTVANFNKAKDIGHYIIPVINKIDMPNLDLDKCLLEIDKLGLDITKVKYISAKNNIGIKELIDEIILSGPCPQSSYIDPRAIVIDSWYDKYFGVIILIRMLDGIISKNSNVLLMSNNKQFNIMEVGHFTPKKEIKDSLQAGELGYIITNLKDPREVYIGETISNGKAPALPGFQKPKPLVFCMFYPVYQDDGPKILDALTRYQLNDTGFVFECETSDVYGLVFRCGFLGLLHLDIVKERIFREFNLELTVTIPSVEYKIINKNNQVSFIKNPNEWPNASDILQVEELEVDATIYTKIDYIGPITTLCMSKRSVNLDVNVEEEKAILKFRIPLSEVIINFYDNLQQITSGYSSLTYEIIGYRTSDVGKLIILLNDEVVEEFSMIVAKEYAKGIATKIADQLAEIIPRKQVKIKIQVALDSTKNIMARQDISPVRKDVIAKCYGGDITRKKKLLENQKKGKKHMLKNASILESFNINKLNLSLAIKF